MRNEKLNRFFNKINQEFFICKRHLMSCDSLEKAQTVSEWASNINTKWDNEIDMLTENMSTSDRLECISHYTKLNEAMAEEWKELCGVKIGELSPQPEEPQYQKPVVIKGFC